MTDSKSEAASEVNVSATQPPQAEFTVETIAERTAEHTSKQNVLETPQPADQTTVETSRGAQTAVES